MHSYDKAIWSLGNLELFHDINEWLIVVIRLIVKLSRDRLIYNRIRIVWLITLVT